jgi:hypothetical protein
MRRQRPHRRELNYRFPQTWMHWCFPASPRIANVDRNRPATSSSDSRPSCSGRHGRMHALVSGGRRISLHQRNHGHPSPRKRVAQPSAVFVQRRLVQAELQSVSVCVSGPASGHTINPLSTPDGRRAARSSDTPAGVRPPRSTTVRASRVGTCPTCLNRSRCAGGHSFTRTLRRAMVISKRRVRSPVDR